MVNLTEQRYLPASVWFAVLMIVGLVFLIRGSRFYDQNVRHLLIGLLFVLLFAIVLATQDDHARDGILNAVSSFKGDMAQEDDLTLVVLKLR